MFSDIKGPPLPTLPETPTDPEIPTLAAVLDPAELARQLSALLGWDPSGGIRLRVLQWKRASRCTLQIALRTARGWEELIGKVYAEDRSDVYRAMQALRHAGFDSDAEFGIPRAIAFLTPLHLLLYEKAPGLRARNLIVDSTGSDRVRAVERCAHWLARFHARAPRAGPVVHPTEYLRTLERAGRRLVGHDGPLADKASRLGEHLNVIARGLGTLDLCAGHGMYTPAQVLLADERTVTIDWDTHNVADPAHDVARFLVALKRLGLKYSGALHVLDAVGDAFLRTYVAAGRSDVARRLPFQEAAICLERAHHDVERREPGWGERAEIMLNEGLRVLASVAP